MLRPCFLVVDQEFPGSISTRKLVIETAKLNVITAYSGEEAIDLLKRFPAVNGVIVDAGMQDMATSDLIKALKKLQPKIPFVVISTPGSEWVKEADHHLEYFDPIRLLALLKELVPKESAEINARENDLKTDAT